MGLGAQAGSVVNFASTTDSRLKNNALSGRISQCAGRPSAILWSKESSIETRVETERLPVPVSTVIQCPLSKDEGSCVQ